MVTIKSVLNDVYVETISIDDAITGRAQNVVKEFVEEIFIDEMKNSDSLFKALFQKNYYAGSFYDGLRVGSVTKFQLNLVLGLPFTNEHIELVTNSSKDRKFYSIIPGSVVYCSDKSFKELIPASHAQYKECEGLEKFFETVHYSGLIFRTYKYVFLPNKMYSWFESVVMKTMENVKAKYTSWLGRKWYGSKFNYAKDSEIIELNIYKSAPGFSLHISCESGFEIDVVLVPVLEHNDITLVPKPYNNERLWRLSYPIREQNIFHDKSCGLKVMKLLKRFRDMQGDPWKMLSYYYLKTIVLFVLHPSPSWLDGEVDEVFIRCLKRLLQCLNDRKIPYFFDETYNLLQENINGMAMAAIKGRLECVLKDIEKNPPGTLRKYFTKENCCTDTIDGEQPSSCAVM